jgi:hypothetical protein
MELATLQRQLRDLIKGTPIAGAVADPYIEQVAQSAALPVLQEIIALWRGYDLDRTCVLTVTLLRHRGLFQSAIRQVASQGALSPYIDAFSAQFLAAASQLHDPLVASVARFELALQQVRRGDEATYVVDWPCEPYAVLQALLAGDAVPESPDQQPHRTTIARALPRLFSVVPLSPADPAAAAE